MWGKAIRAFLISVAVLLLPQGVETVAGQGLTVSTSVNQSSFVAGDTLTISVAVNNPGLPVTVDFYFGALLPDQNTIVFFTDLAFNAGVGSLLNVASLRPIVAGVNLSSPFNVADMEFFSYMWGGTEPFGSYLIFLAATQPGAFADNSIDPGDIVALSTATFTFGACGNAVVDPGEECDDGNHVAGDGCSPSCRVEACGNGVLDPGEQCDDGNQTAGDGCDPNCQVEAPAGATVFRFSDLDLRDPHFFADFLGCTDITSFFNDSLQDSITLDGADPDQFLDLSLLLIFRPLDQSVPGGSVDFGQGDCTAADMSCSPPLDPQALTYNNLDMGTCVQPASGTLSDYMPGVTTPAGPCFSTAPATVTLAIALEGTVVTLHGTEIGARYFGLPASFLDDGLVKGFLTESDADSIIIPASVPIVGGDPLSSILRGGTGNCAPGSDKDMVPDGAGGEISGWWFYLNFDAQPVPFTEP